MEPNDRDELIVRYLCGDASADEIAQINLLRDTDTAFRKEFETLKFSWEHAAMPKFDAEQDWNNIRRRVAFQTKVNSPVAFFMRVAAMLTLVLSVSTALWFYWNVPGYGRWIVFETGLESDSIVLPDESIVFLNRNSSLKFRSAFTGTDRNVALQGEGFFDVKPDKSRPFNVEVGAVSVDVLGTSFHLNGTRSDGIVELNVTHGAVLFKNNNEKITVKEGEWGIAGAKVIGKGLITNPNFISWKTGLLEFNSASVSEVAIALNNHFVEIEEVKIIGGSDIYDCGKPCLTE